MSDSIKHVQIGYNFSDQSTVDWLNHPESISADIEIILDVILSKIIVFIKG